MIIMASIGDGVMYHGSMTDAHGLYVVLGEDPQVPGRWVLATPDGDPRNVLFHVRPTSFEVLLSGSALADDDWEV